MADFGPKNRSGAGNVSSLRRVTSRVDTAPMREPTRVASLPDIRMNRALQQGFRVLLEEESLANKEVQLVSKRLDVEPVVGKTGAKLRGVLLIQEQAEQACKGGHR